MLFAGWEKHSFSSSRILSVGKVAMLDTSNNRKHGKTIASPSFMSSHVGKMFLLFPTWEMHPQLATLGSQQSFPCPLKNVNFPQPLWGFWFFLNRQIEELAFA